MAFVRVIAVPFAVAAVAFDQNMLPHRSTPCTFAVRMMMR